MDYCSYIMCIHFYCNLSPLSHNHAYTMCGCRYLTGVVSGRRARCTGLGSCVHHLKHWVQMVVQNQTTLEVSRSACSLRKHTLDTGTGVGLGLGRRL